jgi:hypothetical protein
VAGRNGAVAAAHSEGSGLVAVAVGLVHACERCVIALSAEYVSSAVIATAILPPSVTWQAAGGGAGVGVMATAATAVTEADVRTTECAP